ncbi:MAG: hypothetical protein ABIH92_04270 [Nanoarchaeota archaeon]
MCIPMFDDDALRRLRGEKPREREGSRERLERPLTAYQFGTMDDRHLGSASYAYGVLVRAYGGTFEID